MRDDPIPPPHSGPPPPMKPKALRMDEIWLEEAARLEDLVLELRDFAITCANRATKYRALAEAFSNREDP